MTTLDKVFGPFFNPKMQKFAKFVQAFISGLESTANGKGASMISIEDALLLFAGENIEAVLTEIKLAQNRMFNTMIKGDKILNEATIAIGSTKTNVAYGQVDYLIDGAHYRLAANAVGVALAAVTVPQNKYGAWAFDVGADGTVDVIAATDNATGYVTATNALAGIAAVAANHVRLGWLTAMSSDAGGFVAGTTELDAAAVTEVYYDAQAHNTGLISSAAMAEDDAVANKVEIFKPFEYMIQGTVYQKAIANSIALAGDPVKQNKYGAFRIVINSSGTVSCQDGPTADDTGEKQQHASAVAALAELAKIPVTGDNCPIATLVFSANGGDFTPDSSDLTDDAANVAWADASYLFEKMYS